MRSTGSLRSCGESRSRPGTPSLKNSMSMGYMHLWHCNEAVTAIAAWGPYIVVATISGSLNMYDLQTYQHSLEISGHNSSILVMHVHGDLLFTGSSESIVKIWQLSDQTEETLPSPVLRYTIYCLDDVGEIFSLAYCERTRTVYFGTQNASIFWVALDGEWSVQSRKISHHPAVRPNKFFDSTGPGGKFTPPQLVAQKHMTDGSLAVDWTLVEVPKDNRIVFAHNSFVYAMAASYNTQSGEWMLITGAGDGTLKLWGLKSSGRLRELACYEVEDSILSLSFASFSQVYCGLASGSVLALDLDTWQSISHVTIAKSPLLAVAVSGDMLYAAQGSSILTYHPKSASFESWPTSSTLTALSTIPSRPGYLLTAARDGSIALWDVQHKDSLTPLNNKFEDWKKEFTTDSIIKTLISLVQYKSISNRSRQYWSECHRCASAVRDLARSLGAETDLWKVEDGNPIVYAHFKSNAGNSNPAHIIFYGHYDVIETSNDWKTPPFELTARDGFLYGRGISDNKGPFVAAIYAAGESWAAGRLANNITFLIEGEEECGSFGFRETALTKIPQIGHVDWIIFSNSYWLDDSIPCLNYGLRGVVFAEIEIRSKNPDMHSGLDGGLYREPLKDMVKILAKLTDESGENALHDFQKKVLPISESEAQFYADIAKVPGIALSTTELMRRWRFPSLTLHKVDVSGHGNQTVIPSSVTASISIRLVPNQTANEIKEKLMSFLTSAFAELTSTNQLEINVPYSADPWLGDPHNKAFQLLAEAVSSYWGIEPLFIREGGSIPVARELEKMFGAPAAQLPCGQSSDGAHLNNERLRIKNLLAARDVFKEVFNRLPQREDKIS